MGKQLQGHRFLPLSERMTAIDLDDGPMLMLVQSQGDPLFPHSERIIALHLDRGPSWMVTQQHRAVLGTQR